MRLNHSKKEAVISMPDNLSDKMKCGITIDEGLWRVKIYYSGKYYRTEHKTYNAAEKHYEKEMAKYYGRENPDQGELI